jgi:hypothetical protein
MSNDKPIIPPPATLDEADQLIEALLPDNKTGEITPARLRAAFDVIIAAIKAGVDR